MPSSYSEQFGRQMALRKRGQELGISLVDGEGRGCRPQGAGSLPASRGVQPLLPSGSGLFPKGSVCDMFGGAALSFNQ